ncbi:MAG: hypothetical protein QOH41_106 [Blastocatellia bacterium]|nr:hypothetical protein [Blastocatellia bacterium]
MAITRNFSVTTDISLLPEIANSLGVHLAAKLQGFASDERTLTDEFCDMICIWATHGHFMTAKSQSAGSTTPIVLDIEKVSSQREIVVGADLEFIVRSPLGAKRVLAQAKVLDPQSLKLRCDFVAGWEKLRVQLAKCRAHAGPLAYLLVYVPEGELNGMRYTFETWEQHSVTRRSGADSRFGATFIDVDKLLDKDDSWSNKPPLSYLGAGRFRPAGVSFTQLMLELLTCARGVWSLTSPSLSKSSVGRGDDERGPYRVLDMNIGGVERSAWVETLVPYLRGILNEVGEG